MAINLYSINLGGGGGGGGAVSSVNGQTGVVVITKVDVGLGNAAGRCVSGEEKTLVEIHFVLARLE